MPGQRDRAARGSAPRSLAHPNIAELKAAVDFRALVAETHTIGPDNKVRCPNERAHKGGEDDHPSCHIYPDGRFYCFVCGARGDVLDWLELAHGLTKAQTIEELRRRGGGRHSTPRKPRNRTTPKQKLAPDDKKVLRGTVQRSSNSATPSGLTLERYAESKHLDVAELKAWGLSTIPHHPAANGPAVKIPYLNENSEELAVRFRVSLDTKPKLIWRKGAKATPYGLWRGDVAREGYAVLVEGESDSQTGWHYNLPVLGAPGANTWNPEWVKHVEGAEQVYVIQEPDEAGKRFVEKVAATPGLAERLYIITLESVKDLSELHLQDSEHFAERWQAAKDKAMPYADIRAAEIEHDLRAALEECKELAEQGDILKAFWQSIQSRVSGLEKQAKLLFLALISRLFTKPLSVKVTGPSSAGKSWLMDRVREFFSEAAYYVLTGMSEKSLVYSDEPLVNRVLMLYEAAGVSGDFSAYLLRSALSEGRLLYETVEKSPGGELEPRRIVKEGPFSIITSTTRTHLDRELDTRLLEVSVPDTPEQTKRVLLAIAKEDEEPSPDFAPWHALQTWLELGVTAVTIPYAEALAELVPPVAVRMRRDFSKVLTLIRAHALLHRASRKLERGKIVATLGDYAAVRELVKEPLADVLEAGVPTAIRETVEKVGELTEGDKSITVTRLAHALKLDKSAASRRARKAAEHGWLTNLEDKRGKPARYITGEPLPEEVEVLPTVEKLAEKVNPKDSFQSEQAECRTVAQPLQPPTQHSEPVPDSESGSGCTVAPLSEGSLPPSDNNLLLMRTKV